MGNHGSHKSNKNASTNTNSTNNNNNRNYIASTNTDIKKSKDKIFPAIPEQKDIDYNQIFEISNETSIEGPIQGIIHPSEESNYLLVINRKGILYFIQNFDSKSDTKIDKVHNFGKRLYSIILIQNKSKTNTNEIPNDLYVVTTENSLILFTFSPSSKSINIEETQKIVNGNENPAVYSVLELSNGNLVASDSENISLFERKGCSLTKLKEFKSNGFVYNLLEMTPKILVAPKENSCQIYFIDPDTMINLSTLENVTSMIFANSLKKLDNNFLLLVTKFDISIIDVNGPEISSIYQIYNMGSIINLKANLILITHAQGFYSKIFVVDGGNLISKDDGNIVYEANNKIGWGLYHCLIKDGMFISGDHYGKLKLWKYSPKLME